MATQYIERPSPPYRSCVAISRIAFHYEYPKHMDKFIWSIPSQYETLVDREISALVSCWIYDGTRKSIEVARKVDKFFDGSPSKFILQRRYILWLMDKDQEQAIYKTIKISDFYNLAAWINQIYTKYGSFKMMLEFMKADDIHSKLSLALGKTSRFKGMQTDNVGRRNLFLFMMAHCFEEYDIPSTDLKAPLFDAVILPNCRTLHIITKKTKKKEYVDIVTNHLKWFSENHPMTFWVGIACHTEYGKEHPKLFKKFAQQTVTLRKIKKR